MANVVRRVGWGAVAWVYLAGPLYGDTVSVGYLQILADNPSPGMQQVTIFNNTGTSSSFFTNTGSGCTASYAACTNLSFTSWTLTVEYASSYYNGGGGPNLPQPYVATSATFGDITNSSTNNVFNFDLCGSDPGYDNCTPATTITSIEFSGEISSSTFCLYDDASGGCPTDHPITFIADPHFDMSWNDSSPQSPYVDENNPYTTSPDIMVNAITPEPNSFVMVTALLPPFVLLLRRRRSVWKL